MLVPSEAVPGIEIVRRIEGQENINTIVILLSVISIWGVVVMTPGPNFSNPKTAMFITSLFASVLPKEPTLSIGMLIVVLMVIISLSWYSLVVLIFASKKFVSAYNKMQRWIEGFAGIIFIAFGVKLVFGNR